ncbi:hypothetical protein Tco_1110386 [Tanacetum coccineum]|uniref:Uncharacterized protein n=1 Tax=Tanacetum coccineum TaxID=301880 RepID=A0ABQ5IKS5_9ASTR
MPTEIELILDQIQQGFSYEVSNIRVISFTMKMEILLEPTSNKLVKDINTTAGNPVKKILLKLNLSDHRSILTDLKEYLKMVMEQTDNQEKDEKQSQNDKTGLGMEKTVKDKAKSKPESQSSQKVNRKVNWSKSKSTPGPKSKKYKFRG